MVIPLEPKTPNRINGLHNGFFRFFTETEILKFLYSSWSGINLCGGHCLTFAVGSLCGSCQNLFLLTFHFWDLPAFLFVLFSLSLDLKCVRQKRKAAPWHSYLFLQLLSLWKIHQKPCVKSCLSSALHPSKVSKDLHSGNPITLLMPALRRCMCFTFCLIICTRSCLLCFVGNTGKITLFLRTLLLFNQRACPPTQNNLAPSWRKAWGKRRVTHCTLTAARLLHLIWKLESLSSPPKILCCQFREAKLHLWQNRW